MRSSCLCLLLIVFTRDLTATHLYIFQPCQSKSNIKDKAVKAVLGKCEANASTILANQQTNEKEIKTLRTAVADKTSQIAELVSSVLNLKSVVKEKQNAETALVDACAQSKNDLGVSQYWCTYRDSSWNAY